MSEGDGSVLTGGCLCGSVRYEAGVPLRPVIICHCRQCARWSGHVVAATSVPNTRLKLRSDRHLKWYRSSKLARRGFCGNCGSSLFWRPDNEDRTSLMAGTLDHPTGLRVHAHIHVATKGDYYEIGNHPRQYLGDDEDIGDPTCCEKRCGRSVASGIRHVERKLPLRSGTFSGPQSFPGFRYLPLRPMFVLGGSRLCRDDGKHTDLQTTGKVTWYRSSDRAERGFCKECGSSLFWRPIGGEGTDISLGVVTPPTGLTAKDHIFVADKSDYYDIDDGLPHYPQARPK